MGLASVYPLTGFEMPGFISSKDTALHGTCYAMAGCARGVPKQMRGSLSYLSDPTRSDISIVERLMLVLDFLYVFAMIVSDLDGQLTSANHIAALNHSCCFHIRQLRSVRQSFATEATKPLAHKSEMTYYVSSGTLNSAHYNIFTGQRACWCISSTTVQNARYPIQNDGMTQHSDVVLCRSISSTFAVAGSLAVPLTTISYSDRRPSCMEQPTSRIALVTGNFDGCFRKRLIHS